MNARVIPLHAEGMEDWTGGEPTLSPNVRLLAELRTLKHENRVLQTENRRLARVELNARAVCAHAHAGSIDAHGPLACMALVELGASVYMPVTRGRT